MSESTKIEWATSSWNPWLGCTKVSPGCAHCYAEISTPMRAARAKGQELWGKGKARRRTSAAYWRDPVKWNRHAEFPGTAIAAAAGVPMDRPRIFPSLCDWLDDEVPIEWLADFIKLIHDTPNLDWLLLTKRPENFLPRMVSIRESEATAENATACMTAMDWRNGYPPPNVWLGVSVEDQQRADERIPALLRIPAKVRFLSVEPLLGEIDLLKWILPTSADEIKSRQGRYCDASSGSGASSDKDQWNNLEAVRKEGGEGPRKRLSSNPVHGEYHQGIRLFTQDRLPKVQRPDSAGPDDQSQEWHQVGQQTGQSGTGNLPGTDSTCEVSSRQASKAAGSGDERHGEIGEGGSEGDSSEASKWRKAQVDSRGFPSLGPDGFKDRLGRTLEINLVIVGGESGPKARPCHVEWIRSVVAQCKAASVPCFVKQLGARPIDGSHEGNLLDAAGLSLLRHSKGGDPSEWPVDLRVREFPQRSQ